MTSRAVAILEFSTDPKMDPLARHLADNTTLGVAEAQKILNVAAVSAGMRPTLAQRMCARFGKRGQQSSSPREATGSRASLADKLAARSGRGSA